MATAPTARQLYGLLGRLHGLQWVFINEQPELGPSRRAQRFGPNTTTLDPRTIEQVAQIIIPPISLGHTPWG